MLAKLPGLMNSSWGEIVAGGVVDDSFGAADFTHRFLERAGEVVVGGHVRGIDGECVAGGSGGDERDIAGKVAWGTGEKGNLCEAMCGK